MNPKDAQTDGFDYVTGLNRTLGEIQQAIHDYKARGVTAAKAKADYKAAVAKEQLRLRAAGKMPASLIKDAVYACGAVEDAYFDALLQETLLDADKETILMRKREADVFRESIARMHAEGGGWR